MFRRFSLCTLIAVGCGDDPIATVEFDTTQFHDEPLTDGATYTYMVMSVNGNGEGHSDEVEYTH